MVKPLGINKVREIAESKNFICLSTEYKNNSTKMWFRCKLNNHKFHKTAQKLRSAKNCPICIGYYSQARDTIEDLRKYAESKKGKCLSKKYEFSDQYYTWKCEYGHKWDAKWNAVKNNKS